MNENHFTFSLIHKQTKKYGEISDELPMTSAMTSCADWLNSTPAETKVEPFGLSLWSQRKTNPKSELTHCHCYESLFVSNYRHATFRADG